MAFLEPSKCGDSLGKLLTGHPGERSLKPQANEVRRLNKPLLALAGIALLGTAGVTGAIVASSGGEQEVQQISTTTASPSTSASPEPSLTPSPNSPTPSPSVTPASTPDAEGFALYTYQATAAVPSFSFAYPGNWFLAGGNNPEGSSPSVTIILTPWDPKTAPGHGGIPTNSLKVDIYAVDYGLQASGCAQANDSSQPAELAGEAGWVSTNPVESDPSVIARVVAADHAGFQYCVVGYFSDPPDPTIFDRIIESFRFLD